MISYRDSDFDQVSVHFIGNRAEEAGVKLSENTSMITSEVLKEGLLRYFLGNFKDPQFFAFSQKENEANSNPMFQWCEQIFSDPTSLHSISQDIANHLYAHSIHPAIKSGELMVTLIKDVVVEDEVVDAIGIFKSEVKDAFLKLKELETSYDILQERGVAINKLDKGCLIFNTEKSQGYKLCIIDHSNKNNEAVFWRNDFLDVTYREDNYHNTTVYIQATKDFIDEKLKPEFQLDKKDEAAILNASKDYFNHAEKFDENNYLESIFSDNDNLKTEFNDFKRERQLDFSSNFDISEPAVKKHNGIFRSILKLDRNFSVYIHGNKNMIEKGEDPDGRKFYKLYYEKEK